jgi:hypothetical protein
MNTEYGQIPGRTRDFSLVFITVQTGSGAKAVSCLIGAGAYTHPENSREGICLQAVPRLRVHTEIPKYYFIFKMTSSFNFHTSSTFSITSHYHVNTASQE